MINNFASVYDNHPFFSMFGLGAGLFTITALIFFIVALGVIALKGYAMWHAAKRDEKGWFVALLVINTFGILELIYLYFIVEKWKKPKHYNTETSSQSTPTPPPTPPASDSSAQ